MGVVMRLCWSDLIWWDFEYPLKWICLAIYINEHINATNIISGDLTWMNKSQCYWIIFCLKSAMCATNLTSVVTRALSFTLPNSDCIVSLLFPSYFDLSIAFLQSCIRFLAHLWLFSTSTFCTAYTYVQS